MIVNPNSMVYHVGGTVRFATIRCVEGLGPFNKVVRNHGGANSFLRCRCCVSVSNTSSAVGSPGVKTLELGFQVGAKGLFPSVP